MDKLNLVAGTQVEKKKQLARHRLTALDDCRVLPVARHHREHPSEAYCQAVLDADAVL